jgi:hypothetical protein
MTGQSPTSQPFPDEAIALARGIATRHVRSDRLASLVWAVVFGAAAPGKRVVCVEPRHSLVATCKLERDPG